MCDKLANPTAFYAVRVNEPLVTGFELKTTMKMAMLANVSVTNTTEVQSYFFNAIYLRSCFAHRSILSQQLLLKWISKREKLAQNCIIFPLKGFLQESMLQNKLL